jgi:hypothetical protein
MSQRRPFSTVSCFRRFVSRDKISHYFDRLISQRLYYDAEIAWMISPPSARPNFFKSAPLTWNPGSAPDINLNMYIINVIADDESKIGLYEI